MCELLKPVTLNFKLPRNPHSATTQTTNMDSFSVVKTSNLIQLQEVLERTNLPTFLTLFKSKLSFGKSQFYYIFIFHSFTAKVK
jgi:hypothetical protein